MTRKTTTIPTGLLLTGAVWPAVSMRNRRDEIAQSDTDNESNLQGEDALWGDGAIDALEKDENQNDSAHWLEESWPARAEAPIESSTEAATVDASNNPNKNRDVT